MNNGVNTSKLAFLATSWVVVTLLVTGSVFGDADSDRDRAYTHLKTFTHSLRLVERHYVDEVELEAVMRGAYRGMVEGLDPFSSWLSPQAVDLVETRLDQPGPGITLMKGSNGFARVASVRYDSPAWREGVRAGRWIEQIDGHTTKEITLLESQALLHGKEGTTVRLLFFEEDEEEGRELELERVPAGSHLLVSETGRADTAHVRLLDLERGAADALAESLEGLEAAGTKRLVLDLRTNPGGLPEEARRVADLFLEGGEVYEVFGRNDEPLRVVEAGAERLFGGPVVVLVGPGTLGEAEVLALALDQRERAGLVGGRTLGKGFRQEMITFPDGTAVHLSTEEYRGPGGLAFHGEGVEPDVKVAEDEDEEGDEVLEAAIESLDEGEGEQRSAA